jgi:hypothetical protein
MELSHTSIIIFTTSLFLILSLIGLKQKKDITKSFDLDRYPPFLACIIMYITTIIYMLLSTIHNLNEPSFENIYKLAIAEGSYFLSFTNVFLIAIAFLSTLHRFKVLNQQNNVLTAKNAQLELEQTKRDNRQLQLDKSAIFYDIRNHFCDISTKNNDFHIDNNKLFKNLFKDTFSSDFSINPLTKEAITSNFELIENLINNHNNINEDKYTITVNSTINSLSDIGLVYKFSISKSINQLLSLLDEAIKYILETIDQLAIKNSDKLTFLNFHDELINRSHNIRLIITQPNDEMGN